MLHAANWVQNTVCPHYRHTINTPWLREHVQNSTQLYSQGRAMLSKSGHESYRFLTHAFSSSPIELSMFCIQFG